RSLMPVRSVIHASLVSTIDSRRALVRAKSGTYPWTAVMAAVVFMDRNGHVFGRGTKGASWSLERLVDAFMQFAFHHLPGEQQHVLHRMLVADAMADDHAAVHAQHRCTPVVLVIKAFQEGVRAHVVLHQVVEALQGLQYHIAGEAIAHHHVGLVLKEVPAFH